MEVSNCEQIKKEYNESIEKYMCEEVRTMKSIINPWFIYLAGACDEIRDVLGFLFLVGLIPCICIAVMYFLSFTDDELDVFRSTIYLELLKKCAIVSVVSLLLCGLIPTSNTCYQMIIASQVTDTNIQKAEDVIKRSVDYIFEKINEK